MDAEVATEGDGFVVSVKFGGQTIDVRLPANGTVGDLQDRLEKYVPARQQKLMCRGRVISGQPRQALADAGIGPRAKLMLLSSQPGASQKAQSQGKAALAALHARREELRAAREQQRGSSAVPGSSAAAAAAPAAAMAARAAVWQKTKIAALRDLKLEAVPGEVFTVEGLRVLDLGANRLASLPGGFSQLSGLQRLRLSINALDDQAWPALCALRQLAVLCLDSNRLAAVPEAISQLGQLQKLSANDNQIGGLPEALGRLTCLRALSLAGNRLAALPAALGRCTALEEADLRRNRLESLPPGLGGLTALKALLLDGNRVAAVPPDLLERCSSLATLSLHDNPVTIEALRETPGYAAHDARRRSKHDRQIGMRVLHGSFDEGADFLEFEHYK